MSADKSTPQKAPSSGAAVSNGTSNVNTSVLATATATLKAPLRTSAALLLGATNQTIPALTNTGSVFTPSYLSPRERDRLQMVKRYKDFLAAERADRRRAMEQEQQWIEEEGARRAISPRPTSANTNKIAPSPMPPLFNITKPSPSSSASPARNTTHRSVMLAAREEEDRLAALAATEALMDAYQRAGGNEAARHEAVQQYKEAQRMAQKRAAATRKLMEKRRLVHLASKRQKGTTEYSAQRHRLEDVNTDDLGIPFMNGAVSLEDNESFDSAEAATAAGLEEAPATDPSELVFTPSLNRKSSGKRGLSVVTSKIDTGRKKSTAAVSASDLNPNKRGSDEQLFQSIRSVLRIKEMARSTRRKSSTIRGSTSGKAGGGLLLGKERPLALNEICSERLRYKILTEEELYAAIETYYSHLAIISGTMGEGEGVDEASSATYNSPNAVALIDELLLLTKGEGSRSPSSPHSPSSPLSSASASPRSVSPSIRSPYSQSPRERTEPLVSIMAIPLPAHPQELPRPLQSYFRKLSRYQQSIDRVATALENITKALFVLLTAMRLAEVPSTLEVARLLVGLGIVRLPQGLPPVRPKLQLRPPTSRSPSIAGEVAAVTSATASPTEEPPMVSSEDEMEQLGGKGVGDEAVDGPLSLLQFLVVLDSWKRLMLGQSMDVDQKGLLFPLPSTKGQQSPRKFMAGQSTERSGLVSPSNELTAALASLTGRGGSDEDPFTVAQLEQLSRLFGLRATALVATAAAPQEGFESKVLRWYKKRDYALLGGSGQRNSSVSSDDHFFHHLRHPDGASPSTGHARPNLEYDLAHNKPPSVAIAVGVLEAVRTENAALVLAQPEPVDPIGALIAAMNSTTANTTIATSPGTDGAPNSAATRSLTTLPPQTPGRPTSTLKTPSPRFAAPPPLPPTQPPTYVTQSTRLNNAIQMLLDSQQGSLREDTHHYHLGHSSNPALGSLLVTLPELLTLFNEEDKHLRLEEFLLLGAVDPLSPLPMLQALRRHVLEEGLTASALQSEAQVPAPSASHRGGAGTSDPNGSTLGPPNAKLPPILRQYVHQHPLGHDWASTFDLPIGCLLHSPSLRQGLVPVPMPSAEGLTTPTAASPVLGSSNKGSAGQLAAPAPLPSAAISEERFMDYILQLFVEAGGVIVSAAHEREKAKSETHKEGRLARKEAKSRKKALEELRRIDEGQGKSPAKQLLLPSPTPLKTLSNLTVELDLEVPARKRLISTPQMAPEPPPDHQHHPTRPPIHHTREHTLEGTAHPIPRGEEDEATISFEASSSGSVVDEALASPEAAHHKKDRSDAREQATLDITHLHIDASPIAVGPLSAADLASPTSIGSGNAPHTSTLNQEGAFALATNVGDSVAGSDIDDDDGESERTDSSAVLLDLDDEEEEEDLWATTVADFPTFLYMLSIHAINLIHLGIEVTKPVHMYGESAAALYPPNFGANGAATGISGAPLQLPLASTTALSSSSMYYVAGASLIAPPDHRLIRVTQHPAPTNVTSMVTNRHVSFPSPSLAYHHHSPVAGRQESSHLSDALPSPTASEVARQDSQLGLQQSTLQGRRRSTYADREAFAMAAARAVSDQRYRQEALNGYTDFDFTSNAVQPVVSQTVVAEGAALPFFQNNTSTSMLGMPPPMYLSVSHQQAPQLQPGDAAAPSASHSTVPSPATLSQPVPPSQAAQQFFNSSAVNISQNPTAASLSVNPFSSFAGAGADAGQALQLHAFTPLVASTQSPSMVAGGHQSVGLGGAGGGLVSEGSMLMGGHASMWAYPAGNGPDNSSPSAYALRSGLTSGGLLGKSSAFPSIMGAQAVQPSPLGMRARSKSMRGQAPSPALPAHRHRTETQRLVDKLDRIKGPDSSSMEAAIGEGQRRLTAAALARGQRLSKAASARAGGDSTSECKGSQAYEEGMQLLALSRGMALARHSPQRPDRTEPSPAMARKADKDSHKDFLGRRDFSVRALPPTPKQEFLRSGEKHSQSALKPVRPLTAPSGSAHSPQRRQFVSSQDTSTPPRATLDASALDPLIETTVPREARSASPSTATAVELPPTLSGQSQSSIKQQRPPSAQPSEVFDRLFGKASRPSSSRPVTTATEHRRLLKQLREAGEEGAIAKAELEGIEREVMGGGDSVSASYSMLSGSQSPSYSRAEVEGSSPAPKISGFSTPIAGPPSLPREQHRTPWRSYPRGFGVLNTPNHTRSPGHSLPQEEQAKADEAFHRSLMSRYTQQLEVATRGEQ